MTKQAIWDNLLDAGCDAETARQFLALEQTGARQAQLELLSAHRRQLLELLHREERRIDCLDYLIYQMEKENPRSGAYSQGGK